MSLIIRSPINVIQDHSYDSAGKLTPDNTATIHFYYHHYTAIDPCMCCAVSTADSPRTSAMSKTTKIKTPHSFYFYCAAWQLEQDIMPPKGRLPRGGLSFQIDVHEA